jgi:hypothetical protein
VRWVADGSEFLVEEIGPQLLDTDQDLDDRVHVAEVAWIIKTNDPGLPSMY